MDDRRFVFCSRNGEQHRHDISKEDFVVVVVCFFFFFVVVVVAAVVVCLFVCLLRLIYC